jgi:glutamate racemase
LIKKQIDQFYQDRVDVIDTSLIVANEIKRILIEEDLLNEEKAVDRQFFVSDYTDSFEKSTQIFFGETIKLTQFPIWD